MSPLPPPVESDLHRVQLLLRREHRDEFLPYTFLGIEFHLSSEYDCENIGMMARHDVAAIVEEGGCGEVAAGASGVDWAAAAEHSRRRFFERVFSTIGAGDDSAQGEEDERGVRDEDAGGGDVRVHWKLVLNGVLGTRASTPALVVIQCGCCFNLVKLIRLR